MVNISITRRCKRHCSYCFAQNELRRGLVMDMSPETYQSTLRFLERSNFPEARLLGGEPTEHPKFCEYVTQALERGFRVLVFSGGLVPRLALDYMATLPSERFSLLLNAANPAYDSETLVNRQLELCRVLGRKVMLGVNIRSPNDNPAYVLDWVKKYDLCRTIRLGIAHPIWGGNNEYFKLRGPRTLPVFELFAEKVSEIDANVIFDCGFTPCMFSQQFVEANPHLFAEPCADADLLGIDNDAAGIPSGEFGNSVFLEQELPKNRLEAIGSRCGSVVDILPEGDCIACYALSRFRRISLSSQVNRSDLVSVFDNELLAVLPAGIHRECVQCAYLRNGICNGGCRARKSLRLRRNALITIGPELDKEP